MPMIRPGIEAGTEALDAVAARVREVIAQLPPADELIRPVRAADLGALAAAASPDQPLPPPEVIPRLIDSTLLRPQARRTEIERLCAEARAWGFATVCVNPVFVPLAARLLDGSEVRVTSVAAFPLGASAGAVKAVEAALAIAQGAHEVDVVLAIGELKGGALDRTALEIAAVVGVARPSRVMVTIILETALLTPVEQVIGCLLARAAGADFVKTATGFGPRGATEEAVRRLRAVCGEDLGVKASGGIRTRADLEVMLRAGATRIGTSSAAAIMKEYR